MSELGLGRREPTDWTHVQRHSLQVPALAALMPPVERTLALPWFHSMGLWWQNGYSSCVGHGSSMMMMILNMAQHGRLVRYEPNWLWNESKAIDEWAETNPGDNEGTSVNASCKILRDQGHVIYNARTKKCSVPILGAGITEFKWARSVDDMRAVIAAGVPISQGTSWYTGFDSKYKIQRGNRWEWWVEAARSGIGTYRGGHCTCIYGASDKRQAFKVANSHGDPGFWLPYSVVERLINEGGEFALVTDR